VSAGDDGGDRGGFGRGGQNGPGQLPGGQQFQQGVPGQLPPGTTRDQDGDDE